MQQKLDCDRLISQILIGSLLIGYAGIVYVVVVAIATMPFSDRSIVLSPPWWINLLAPMAQGVNNEEIARRLSFSSKTVRNYVSNIFSKLQVADRAQAIVKAREAGLY